MKELSLRTRIDEREFVAELDRVVEALGDGNLQYKAMANEDAGFAFARLGNREQAESCFESSMDIYLHEWGSLAKYQWLAQKSAESMAWMNDAIVEKSVGPIGDVVCFQEK